MSKGTVLGPTLFLIYINDLPDCIRNECPIFADDSTVYAMGLGSNKEATSMSLSADLSKAAWRANTCGGVCSSVLRGVIS